MKLSPRTLAALTLPAFFATSVVYGQTVTWTSNSTGNWSDTTKWSGGVAPTGNGTFNFIFENPSNGQNPVATNDLAGITASGITIAGTLPARDTTLSGNAITLAGNVAVSTGNWQTFNLPISLSAGNRAFNISNGQLTVGGNLTGTGTLVKDGGARLILGGSNSYSGNTTLTLGTLVASSKTALGATNSTVTFNTAGGAVNTATLELATSDGALTNTYNLNMGSNRFNTILVNRASSGEAAYVLGNLSLGSSTLTFNRGSNISGNASVSLGTLDLSAGNNDRPVILNGSATILVGNAGILSNNATSKRLQLDGSAANNSIGVISNGSGSGVLSLIKDGTSTWTLTGINTFTGGTTVNAGNLTLAAGGAAGSIRGNLTIGSGATVTTTATDALGYNVGTKVNTVNINGGTLTHNAATNLTFSSATVNLTGGTLQSTGAGIIDIYDAQALGGGNPDANTAINSLASATTSIIAGTLRLRQGDNDATGTVFTVADGAASTDLLVSAVVANGSFQGVNSRIQKSGAGTMVLTGNNTYTGGTAVNLGTLLVNNTSGSGTGSGNVTVSSGATLGGIGSISGNVTLNAATIGSASNTLTVGGNLTTTGTSSLAATSTVNVNGSTNVSSGTFTVSGTLGGSGVVNIASGATLAGTATLNSAATLSGGTLGSSGNTLTLTNTLGVSGTNSIVTGATVNVTGTTTISSGVFTVNGTLGGSGAKLVGTSATLAGSGTVSGPVTINGTVAPGNSPGTLSLGSTSFEADGNYNWQVVDAAGVAGTGFDTITLLTGNTLTINATSANPFNINLWSLSSTGPDVNGDAANFNGMSSMSWALVSTDQTIAGFAANKFLVKLIAANGTNGFTNTINGSFTIGLSPDSTDLLLNYTPVPEPSAYAAFAGLGVIAVALHRRRRLAR